MRKVGAREANQNFSKLLREVEGGKSLTITRNGKPVARMEPLAVKPKGSKKERAKAHAELMKLLEKGYDLGGKGFTRDEMHER